MLEKKSIMVPPHRAKLRDILDVSEDHEPTFQFGFKILKRQKTVKWLNLPWTIQWPRVIKPNP
ncbi:hypothetical protein A0256_23750 [Mucilaginibacter sp. PAMC 26640]|nr:hypothetical protein A0256_23750 [Mucilaginibacter sp. PAMC 26640]